MRMELEILDVVTGYIVLSGLFNGYTFQFRARSIQGIMINLSMLYISARMMYSSITR